MDLDARLRAFAAVARTGSFSRAAQATLALEDAPATAAEPVIALIRRLPLLFDE